MTTIIELPSAQNSADAFNENIFKEAFEQSLENVFTCTKEWSCWRNGTMRPVDFIPFNQKDELFLEVFEFFKTELLNKTTENADIECLIVKAFEKAELVPLVNNNIKRNFHEKAFHDLSGNNMDVSPLLLVMIDYQNKNELREDLNSRRKLKKKLRMIT